MFRSATAVAFVKASCHTLISGELTTIVTLVCSISTQGESLFSFTMSVGHIDVVDLRVGSVVTESS